MTMKLISISGNIWELTTLQNEKHAESENDKTPLREKNIMAIKNLGWHRGVVRTIANRGVKSRACAIIETEVLGNPHQMKYDIYHSSKGFYCRVQKIRVYLEELII